MDMCTYLYIGMYMHVYMCMYTDIYIYIYVFIYLDISSVYACTSDIIQAVSRAPRSETASEATLHQP